MPLVAVGSLNPVKINAVERAFTTVWPNDQWVVRGLDTPSKVSPQPMTDSESIQGALNRAQAALKQIAATYGIGLEGGLQKIDQDWFDCGWIVIVNSSGLVGIGSTAKIMVPSKMMAMIEKGQELGTVVDHFFNTSNSRQDQGHFGLMTNNHVTRTSGYKVGVIMALARFLQPQLF